LSDAAKVTLADVRGNKVRLRVTAPKEVRVDRREVYKARRAGTECRKGRAARCDH
jgi:sRNA-binding carbon storage regulator CsrA